MKFKIEPDEGFAEFFQSAIAGSLSGKLAIAKGVMSEVSQAAKGQATQLAAERLHSTYGKYVRNLKLMEAGDGIFTLVLGKDASYLEDGYSEFDMIQAGLASGPASKIGKSGRRYVRIPFEHVQAHGNADNPMNGTEIQGGPQTYGSLAGDLKRIKEAVGDNGPMTGPGGKFAVMGTAYTIRKNPAGPQWFYKDALGNQKTIPFGSGEGAMASQPSELLSGLAKIQYQTKSGQVRSKYMTWRTASEQFAFPPDGKGRSKKDQLAANLKKWIHPGFDGARIFPDLERWILDQVSRKIQDAFYDED